MAEKLDPKLYALHPRTVLLKRDTNKISIVVNPKSRIIMKDAQTILEKAEMIKKKNPETFIFLETTALICSKSIQFLNDNGIEII